MVARFFHHLLAMVAVGPSPLKSRLVVSFLPITAMMWLARWSGGKSHCPVCVAMVTPRQLF